MTIVISDTLGAYGGTHTLTLRMCEWLRSNDYETVVFCEDNGNEEIVKSLVDNGTNIICFDTANVKRCLEELSKLIRHDKVKTISYMWDKYLDLEIAKKKSKLEFENILYCVHYGTFFKGANYPGVTKEIVKTKMFGILAEMNKNHAVIMMDEDTTKKTADYFKSDFKPNTLFARIPMICKEDEGAELIVEKGYNSNTMMSASRAEFPYKGYQIGLVKVFAELKKEYRDIRLLMVSGGDPDDIQKIVDEINTLSDEERKDVEFHKWMDYEELKTKIEECKLFIGMGTSVLEAGLKYKPSITVKYNTFDVIASYLLSERPELVVSPEDSQESAIHLITRILKMTREEYGKEAYRTFNAVKECYDIHNNIGVLLDTHPRNKGSILSNGDIIFIRLLRSIGRIKTRGTKAFDIEKVERDNRK